MLQAMTKEQEKKWYKRAAFWGAVLALVCHALPPEYQTACQALANICHGGF